MSVNCKYENLEPWLLLKADEFKLMGYNEISLNEIWLYLTSFKWKNRQDLSFHQQVSDLSSLKPTEYLSFALMQRQKEAEKEVDLLDIDDLL
ncbi:post-transcriptional regulator [Isobaculum melis]|uniref:Post-transcriptional regulator n=1 Tax=Isobaculum melis TaxID=142588 RepID=A0A1H9RLP2_9LACT|nr:post-transcriptional regulator [Isobaculum melis]SER73670.1 Post-transcriptional regulator [Isobaculum melis]